MITASTGAFPSGEAALTMAAVSVLQLFYPCWRRLPALAAAAEASLLDGLNRHFPSGVVAGGIIGAFGGMIARRSGDATTRPEFELPERNDLPVVKQKRRPNVAPLS